MKLKINRDTGSKEIKNAFAGAFPGLKIEFVSKPHGAGEGSTPDDIIKGEFKVAELNAGAKPVELELTKSNTVNDVEAAFRDKVGLYAQVFRQSGRVWIETVNTDQWTLDMQMDASHR